MNIDLDQISSKGTDIKTIQAITNEEWRQFIIINNAVKYRIALYMDISKIDDKCKPSKILVNYKNTKE